MAKALGVPVGRVMSRLHRARTRIRDLEHCRRCGLEAETYEATSLPPRSKCSAALLAQLPGAQIVGPPKRHRHDRPGWMWFCSFPEDGP